MARAPKAGGDKVVPLRPPAPARSAASRRRARPSPFCSKRCADIDLNRWLSGGYAIPASEAPAEDEPDS